MEQYYNPEKKDESLIKFVAKGTDYCLLQVGLFTSQWPIRNFTIFEQNETTIPLLIKEKKQY